VVNSSISKRCDGGYKASDLTVDLPDFI
jgi:hypothetical protein